MRDDESGHVKCGFRTGMMQSPELDTEHSPHKALYHLLLPPAVLLFSTGQGYTVTAQWVTRGLGSVLDGLWIWGLTVPFVPKSYGLGEFYLSSSCLSLVHLKNGTNASTHYWVRAKWSGMQKTGTPAYHAGEKQSPGQWEGTSWGNSWDISQSQCKQVRDCMRTFNRRQTWRNSQYIWIYWEVIHTTVHGKLRKPRSELLKTELLWFRSESPPKAHASRGWSPAGGATGWWKL
jgi:hypothetical protein